VGADAVDERVHPPRRAAGDEHDVDAGQLDSVQRLGRGRRDGAVGPEQRAVDIRGDEAGT
jgi:hypothetical protein